jgi:hypothetical protein
MKTEWERGYKDGYEEGRQQGYDCGFNRGSATGYHKGWQEGYREGRLEDGPYKPLRKLEPETKSGEFLPVMGRDRANTGKAEGDT